MRALFKNGALLLASLLLTLLLAEVLLRLFTNFPIHGPLANRVPDMRLLYRMDPALDEIDPAGFRNAGLPVQADIVAIGDSHTYGNNVDSADSWPQQLGVRTGLSVYNFGLGGYGPLQYHALVERALVMQPEYLILGLYAANDLKDVCGAIAGSEYWQEWAQRQGFDAQVCIDWFRDKRQADGLAAKLAQRTALGSLLTFVIDAATARDPGQAVIIEHPLNPTVVRHARLSAHRAYLDSNAANIQLGRAATEWMLQDAKARADAAGAVLGVALIPSKQRVYFEQLTQTGQSLPADYATMVRDEEKAMAGFRELCERLAIPVVDLLPYLRAALEESGSVYTATDDGHPGRAGYAAYSRGIDAEIIQHFAVSATPANR